MGRSTRVASIFVRESPSPSLKTRRNQIARSEDIAVGEFFPKSLHAFGSNRGISQKEDRQTLEIRNRLQAAVGDSRSCKVQRIEFRKSSQGRNSQVPNIRTVEPKRGYFCE